MRLLLDTHLLLWAAENPKRLSPQALSLIEDGNNEVFFSAASIWETAIKHSRGRNDFQTEPGQFRLALLANQFSELPVTGEHAAAVAHLLPIHKDPFDRILIAQATIEGITLLTSDQKIASYPGPIRQV